MSDALKVGDVVKLKSGGEKMTIESIDEDGDAICVWFEESQVQRGTFISATLQKHTPHSSSIGITRA